MKSAILVAAYEGNANQLQEMVVSSIDANTCDETNYTAMHAAAQEGYLDVCRLLIARGANVNAVNDLGFSPLDMVVGAGQMEIVRFLVESGADINHRCSGNGNGQPLHTAAAWGALNIAEYLLKSGADLDGSDDDGMTPLMYAAAEKHEEIVSLLLDAGASLSLRNNLGQTARDLIKRAI